MDPKTHLALKKFLTSYKFNELTNFHILYADFDNKQLVPSFKHFVRVLKKMGVKSRSIRRGDKVLRVFYYEPLADEYLGKLYHLVQCPNCEGKGVIKVDA